MPEFDNGTPVDRIPAGDPAATCRAIMAFQPMEFDSGTTISQRALWDFLPRAHEKDWAARKEISPRDKLSPTHAAVGPQTRPAIPPNDTIPWNGKPFLR